MQMRVAQGLLHPQLLRKCEGFPRGVEESAGLRVAAGNMNRVHESVAILEYAG